MNKHAYLIMAYKDIEKLSLLLKQLDFEKNDIYLHIDKKTKFKDYSILYSSVNKSKLYIYSEISVSWGDISQTKCQLFLLEKAAIHGYRYYHLLSESDFPLKSNIQLYNYFEKSGLNYVHFQSNVLPQEKEKWINYYYIFQRYNRHSKFFNLIENINIRIQKFIGVNRIHSGELYACGANWFSINNSLCNYVLDNKNNIINRYKYTRSSDEIYLQTLIINSSFVNTLNNCLFDDNYSSCQRYIDWNRGNPYTFCVDDIEELKHKDYCFVRKVNLNDGIREKIIKEIIEPGDNHE